MSKENPEFSRRDFIKMVAGVAGGALLPPTSESTPTIHSVNFGETLFRIAQKYGLKLSVVVQANPQIEDIDLIEVGQTVFISKHQTNSEAGIEATQTPEIKKIRGPVYWGNRTRPEAVLTFDDGFSKESIEKTLRVLATNDITGTFFIIGSQLMAYPDLWRRAIDEGHEICNHTYTHKYLAGLSDEQIKEELDLWEKAAERVLGKEYVEKMRQEFPYIRFPGGSGHNTERVLRAVAGKGYLPIAWSADTYSAVLKKHNYRHEPVGPIAEEVCQHIISSSQNGSIVLLHFNPWDTDELGATVEGIQGKGIKLVTLPQVLA